MGSQPRRHRAVLGRARLPDPGTGLPLPSRIGRIGPRSLEDRRWDEVGAEQHSGPNARPAAARGPRGAVGRPSRHRVRRRRRAAGVTTEHPVHPRGRPQQRRDGRDAERPQAAGPARHVVLELARQRVALLPVAYDHPARPVRAQHRRADERRRQRGLRDRPPQGGRELDDRDVAPGRGLPHRAVRQVPQRLSQHRPDLVRAAGLERVVLADQRLSLQRVLLHGERQRGVRAVRSRARPVRHRRLRAPDRELHHQGGHGQGSVLRVPSRVRAAQPGSARAPGRQAVPAPCAHRGRRASASRTSRTSRSGCASAGS